MSGELTRKQGRRKSRTAPSVKRKKQASPSAGLPAPELGRRGSRSSAPSETPVGSFPPRRGSGFANNCRAAFLQLNQSLNSIL